MRDGPEFGEALPDGQQRQAFKENRSETMPMEGVVHSHRHFRLMRVPRMVGT